MRKHDMTSDKIALVVCELGPRHGQLTVVESQAPELYAVGDVYAADEILNARDCIELLIVGGD